MSAQPPGRRHFQRSSPRPVPRLPREGEPAARKYFYGKLMQVDFRNDYYPPPAASPDFSVHPTAATLEILQQLGLLFRAGAAGFAVLYDERRKGSLLSWLRHQAVEEGSPPQPQVWTRLSFVLRLENPSFVNFTDIPLDFDPARENFYFSNQRARRRRRGTVLDPGRDGDEILRLVPGQLPVPVGPEVEEVRVLDISNATVLCQPRCVPAELALRMPPDKIPCGSSSPPPEVCRTLVYLDFSLLPEGRYTVEEIGYGGEVRTSWQVLSTVASPIPFAFVDLLLTRPKEGEPGIYPIEGLWRKEPVFTSPDYQLVFQRRSTLWRYYVVLPRGSEREGLEIRSASPPPVRFSGPDPVRLADGTPASLFTSRKPLPLQARPDVHLLLRSDAGVLLDPLPAAASRQVLLAEGPTIPPRIQPCSDIYVYV